MTYIGFDWTAPYSLSPSSPSWCIFALRDAKRVANAETSERIIETADVMEKPGTGDGPWSNFSRGAPSRSSLSHWSVPINLLLGCISMRNGGIRHRRNGASKYVIRYSRAERRPTIRRPISLWIATYFIVLRLTKAESSERVCIVNTRNA